MQRMWIFPLAVGFLVVYQTLFHSLGSLVNWGEKRGTKTFRIPWTGVLQAFFWKGGRWKNLYWRMSYPLLREFWFVNVASNVCFMQGCESCLLLLLLFVVPQTVPWRCVTSLQGPPVLRCPWHQCVQQGHVCTSLYGKSLSCCVKTILYTYMYMYTDCLFSGMTHSTLWAQYISTASRLPGEWFGSGSSLTANMYKHFTHFVSPSGSQSVFAAVKRVWTQCVHKR